MLVPRLWGMARRGRKRQLGISGIIALEDDERWLEHFRARDVCSLSD